MLYLHESGGQGDKAVQGIAHAVQIDLRAGTGERGTIGFALIAQRVKFGCDDQRTRLMAEIFHQKRCKVRICKRTVVLTGVQAHKLLHTVGGQQIPFAVLVYRRKRGGFRVIGSRRRINQNLLTDREITPVTRQKRHSSGQIAAGTVADEGNVLGLHAKLFGIGVNGLGCRVTVLQTDREGKLRGAAVLHRGDPAAGCLGQRLANLIVGVHALKHPAAAVEKQQQLTAGLLFGGVDAHPDGGAVDGLDFLVPQVIQGRERRGLERVQSTLNFIDLFEVCGSRIRQESERCLHMFIDRQCNRFLSNLVCVWFSMLLSYHSLCKMSCRKETKPPDRTRTAGNRYISDTAYNKEGQPYLLLAIPMHQRGELVGILYGQYLFGDILYDVEWETEGDCYFQIKVMLLDVYRLGADTRVVGVLENYEEQKQKDMEIERRRQQAIHLSRRSQHDFLTGLFNRETLEEWVGLYLGSEPERMQAFLILELDHFKEINDTMGHTKGDEVLRDVAGALRHQFRRDDLIARLGGDEFVILLKHLDSDAVIEKLTGALGQALRRTYTQGETSLSISASIGVARAPVDGSTFAELYPKADAALYAVKRRGKDSFQIYHPESMKIARSDKCRAGDLLLFNYTPICGQISRRQHISQCGLVRAVQTSRPW